MSIVEEYLAHFNHDGTPIDVVEASKWLYADYLQPEDLAEVEAMDPGDAAYFWAKLYYDVQGRMDRAILYGMEDRARRNLSKLVRQEEMSPTPFRDAEDAVSAHSWFVRNLIGD